MQRNRPITVDAAHVHDRVERGQRHRHVRGVGRHARRRRTEDRQVVVLALDAPGSRCPGARLLHGLVTSWK